MMIHKQIKCVDLRDKILRNKINHIYEYYFNQKI
jgi:hypothetical protein